MAIFKHLIGPNLHLKTIPFEVQAESYSYFISKYYLFLPNFLNFHYF